MFLDCESSGGTNNLADFEDQDYLNAMVSEDEEVFKPKTKKSKKKILSSDEEDLSNFADPKDNESLLDSEMDQDVADFDTLSIVTPISTPRDYQSDFLEKYCTNDVEEAIRLEKESTYEKLQRLGDSVPMDERYYKEVLLRAKREYTGQHMKAIYTDASKGQFFNVENLALTYYGKK